MPKNKFQEVIFTIMMVFVMVYAMICYNISLNMGGMSNEVFLAAFHELIIMGPIAFVLDFFIVGPIAKKKAFTIVNPQKDNPFMIVLAISVLSIIGMCPLMSLIASILFQIILGGMPLTRLPAIWAGTLIKNFPMAFFWNMFAAAPLVHLIFDKWNGRGEE